jgi:hypothetical protein
MRKTTKERNIEELIKHFPNFISQELREMPIGNLGQVNVCLQQVVLPETSGRIDLAFVSETTVYLVELKRGAVNLDALVQYQGYAAVVQKYYPTHRIEGFVVGMKSIGPLSQEQVPLEHDVKVLILGRDIPSPMAVTRCAKCRAGVSAYEDRCPYCQARLFEDDDGEPGEDV